MKEIGSGREATVFAVLRAKAKPGPGGDKPKTPRVLALRVPHIQGCVSLYTRKLCAMPGHPHVVGIHSVDCASGLMLLEYVGGGTLADELVCDDVLVPRAVRVVEEVLQGAAHLHACGFVHGQICPSNVLVGERGACKLTDFFVHPSGCPGVCGAPAYTAPEAARGDAVCASDVWSAGCLMLAVGGRAPWGGEVRLEDGSVLELRCAAALLYHLACREVAMRGPPEFAAVVACEGLFSDVLARVFVGVEGRASTSTLLALEEWREV